MASPKRTRGTFLLIFGAALSALLAGLFSTFLFLWIYGFDIYRSAFYNRNLQAHSMNFKYIFMAVASLTWFAVFMKWVFRRTSLELN
ncbi:MAG TPA: hypothetical protein VH088_05580 [Terriglobales bacterium]|nr:hypothetical protein [Terriglobales bacterium]